MKKTFLLLLVMGWPLSVPAQQLDLALPLYKHIQFSRITPSHFSNRGQDLVINVEKSSSALLYAFMRPQEISEVSFLWKSNGKLNIKSKKQEASRAGDDSYFRLGLFIQGGAVEVPFFAPNWIKKARNHLKLPTDKILYLSVGAKHPAGEMWVSPYSKSIKLLSVKSVAAGNGFRRAYVKFDMPIRVVGLWLMADGDNTGSRFATTVRGLHLK